MIGHQTLSLREDDEEIAHSHMICIVYKRNVTLRNNLRRCIKGLSCMVCILFLLAMHLSKERDRKTKTASKLTSKIFGQTQN